MTNHAFKVNSPISEITSSLHHYKLELLLKTANVANVAGLLQGLFTGSYLDILANSYVWSGSVGEIRMGNFVLEVNRMWMVL